MYPFLVDWDFRWDLNVLQFLGKDLNRRSMTRKILLLLIVVGRLVSAPNDQRHRLQIFKVGPQVTSQMLRSARSFNSSVIISEYYHGWLDQKNLSASGYQQSPKVNTHGTLLATRHGALVQEYNAFFDHGSFVGFEARLSPSIYSKPMIICSTHGREQSRVLNQRIKELLDEKMLVVARKGTLDLESKNLAPILQGNDDNRLDFDIWITRGLSPAILELRLDQPFDSRSVIIDISGRRLALGAGEFPFREASRPRAMRSKKETINWRIPMGILCLAVFLVASVFIGVRLSRSMCKS